MDCEILAGLLNPEFRTIYVTSGEEAISMLQTHNDFAAVLLDLIMPGIDGYAVLKKIGEMGLLGRMPVIVISAAPSQAELRSLDLGAYDFIRKPFDGRVIKKRVHNAVKRSARENALEAALSSKSLEPAEKATSEEDKRLQYYCRVHDITNREQELLQRLLEGKSNAEIAGELYISLNTVKFHVRNILRKTGCKNRAELLAHYQNRLQQ